MPTLYPAAATPGTALRIKSTGVVVRLISVAGELCQVKLPDGTWTYTPMRDLEYGFNAATVGDAKGPDISPLATTSVRSTELPISGPTGQKVTSAEFVKRVFLESFRRSHPVLAGMVDNGGTIHMPDPLRPGTVLLQTSNLQPVTLISSAPERGLYVVKLASGELLVATSDELLTGDRQPLAKLDGGTLQKGTPKFRKGDRVRTRRGECGTIVESHSVDSVVHVDGLEWENGLKNFDNEHLELL